MARCNGSADLTACWHEGTWTRTTLGIWTPQLRRASPRLAGRGLPALGPEGRRDAVGATRQPHRRPELLGHPPAVNLLYSPDGADRTPVPSTRPDLDPAPGETPPGTTTDDVQVPVDRAWLDQDDPWVADSSAQAQTVLTHLPNRISVSKSPGNGANPPPEFDPDTPIPYALTFQNTGSWPMTGLRLTAADRRQRQGVAAWSGPTTRTAHPRRHTRRR